MCSLHESLYPNSAVLAAVAGSSPIAVINFNTKIHLLQYGYQHVGLVKFHPVIMINIL